MLRGFFLIHQKETVQQISTSAMIKNVNMDLAIYILHSPYPADIREN